MTMPKIDVTIFDSPNFSERGKTKINAIILHNTDGSFTGSVAWLCNPKAQASAHLVIGRAGEVACLVPFSKRAWHAGNSRWNACSLGIELEASKKMRGMTEAQEAALVKWLQWFCDYYKIKPDRIMTHRDVCATDCPGWVWGTDDDFLTWRKNRFGV